MGAKTLGTVRRALMGMLTLAMAACGGGGDGPAAPAGSGARGTVPLALTATETADTSTSALGASEAMLQIGQLASDYAGRYLAPGAPLSSTEVCPNGGIVTVGLTDADGDQQASAGDTVLVDWQDCGLPLIFEVFRGTFTIDIVSVERGPTTRLVSTARLGNGAMLMGTPSGITVQVLGSMDVTWTRSDLLSALEVKSTAANDLRLVGRGGGVTITDAYKAVTLRKELRFDEARSVVTVAMHYESDALGGSVEISTPQPLRAYLNRYPESGRVEIRGAGAGVLVVTPNFVSASEAFIAELDTDGNGTADSITQVPWQEAAMGYLWWDGSYALPFTSQPYFTQPFTATNFELTGRYIDQPGLDDSYRLQFTRPPVNPPALQFRFHDFGSSIASDGVTDIIPATQERRGAVYVLRPERPLRHARQYYVEFSSDGVSWNSAVNFRDALNNPITMTAFNFGFVTPDSLRATVTTSGTVLATADASVRLDGSGSVTSSRPIVAYSWRQLDGTPLALDTPQASATVVRLGATPVTGLESIVIELTVTDAAGDVETSRTTVSALGPTSGSRLLYLRSTTGDPIGQGRVTLVGDSLGSFTDTVFNNGYVIYNYVAPDFNANWALSLATADGAGLRVGAYENAIWAPIRGNQNGLEVGGTAGVCTTISGRFDVLEIETDTNGNISRLAVDFEQRCGGPQAPPLFGSLRVRSALPIRP